MTFVDVARFWLYSFVVLVALALSILIASLIIAGLMDIFEAIKKRIRRER